MTRKCIEKNTGQSGRISLSGPENNNSNSSITNYMNFDIAESKRIACAMDGNSDSSEFTIVSKLSSKGGKK